MVADFSMADWQNGSGQSDRSATNVEPASGAVAAVTVYAVFVRAYLLCSVRMKSLPADFDCWASVFVLLEEASQTLF